MLDAINQRKDWKPLQGKLDPIFRDSFVFRVLLSWRRRNVVNLTYRSVLQFHKWWNLRSNMWWARKIENGEVMKMSFNSASVGRSSGGHLSSFPQYQSLAETYGRSIVHKSYMSDQFARSSGLYHHDLLGHFGCVNAIEFSSNGGEFIVSGEDFCLFSYFCFVFWPFN